MGKNILKSHHLSIYLIKKSFLDNESIIKNISSLKNIEIKPKDNILGNLYIRPSYLKLPRWTKLFTTEINSEDLQSHGSSTAAVLLVKVSDRIFAITFGFGKFLLIPGCYEERFGLIVTLNTILPNTIRSIDIKTFDIITSHSRIQSSREVTTNEFGLDLEQDLLRAITGKPSEKSLGSRMTGFDVLRTSVKVDLYTLKSLLEKYYIKYQEEHYKKEYPWVEQIAEIRDPQLILDLNQQMIDKLQAKELDKIWLAVPEIIDWTNFDVFKYSTSKNKPDYDDIHINSFLESLKNFDDLTIETLKKRRIYYYSTISELPFHKWQIFQCINCELTDRINTFLLSNGKWYKIAQDFVKRINEGIDKIPLSEIKFPEYSESSEKEYNKKVQNQNKEMIALTDIKLIPYGGGYNRFEFCDLYLKNKKIVHVKRYGGSNVLSHLFAQARNSGELFHNAPDFRREVNNILPDSFKLENPATPLKPKEYEIIFAIISKYGEDLEIPFFSKMVLYHSTRQLSGYGYNVSLKYIGIQEKVN